MKDFEDLHDKKVIFAGYLHLICESWISGGSPFLRRHSLSEIIKLNETFNLRYIWRVRNPHKKLFKFRQKRFTGFIQRRLDYIFVSNSLQEPVKKTETLILLRFIYELDKWDKRDFEKSLQSEPPKRKHQNKARKPIISPFSALLLIMTLSLLYQVFGNSIILCCSILTLLTILTGKNCVLFNSVQNGWLAASDLFDMFTQSIKFYCTFYYHLLKIQIFKKCDSANRQ